MLKFDTDDTLRIIPHPGTPVMLYCNEGRT